MIRNPFFHLTALLFLFCITMWSSSAVRATQSEVQQYVGGIVCENINRNGTCDSDEPGIVGVMVSNQRDVVLTDENGYYQLPVEDDMIIFITKPAGYELPLNENNLPEFYYIHQPDGSPQFMEFSGLEPTGSLPESVDFGLTPSEEKESFTAIVFGDPQPRNDTELSYYRDAVVSELATVDADMTLVLGDIMFDDLSMFKRYNGMMSTIGMPVYNIIGNHDLNFDSGQFDTDTNRFARETYKKNYGPTYFSFDYGEVHFIALDNMDYMGRDESGGSQYRGYLSDTHLTWIENNLQYVDEEKLIVLLAHIGLYSMDSDSDRLNTVNRRSLFELLEDRDRVLFLGGHRHVTFQHFLDEEFGRVNPTPIHHIATTAACGSWWRGPENKHGIPIATQMDGVPNGYHVFRFEGNTYSEKYKAAGLDADYQLRIESPGGSITEEELHDTELLVNVFNGSEKSEVKFRINNSEWIIMKRLEEQVSPFYADLHDNYDGPWSNPMSTNHIWRAEVSALEKGVHKIVVWTKDMYGQEFTQTKVIEVE